MADNLTSEQRSRAMSRIRSENTGPEVALRRALWAAGIRGYRTHVRSVPGRPDLCWRGRRVAVFVDGAFWHGHPSAYTPNKSGTYWDIKIARTIARDRAADEVLAGMGWTVLRFWDFEVRRDLPACVRDVARVVRNEPRT